MEFTKSKQLTHIIFACSDPLFLPAVYLFVLFLCLLSSLVFLFLHGLNFSWDFTFPFKKSESPVLKLIFLRISESSMIIYLEDSAFH